MLHTFKEGKLALTHEAEKYIAGGVVSLNRKVVPHIVFEKALGSKVFDNHGREYIDYHAAFAPYLLGHNNPIVNKAVAETFTNYSSLYGSGTNELEVRLAQMVCETVESVEQVQITNTGSEGTAHAIRLSRAYTGREHIILTLGGYNGWHNDVARVVLPSLDTIGERRLGEEYDFIPSSAGIPQSVKNKIHIVGFNDLDAIRTVMNRYPIACVLTEPALQNVGIIHPQPGYLEGILDLCEEFGAVSIFDEVKTGFRTALGGYQSLSGLKPDLSVFGKAIANGYPLGIVGGKKEIMRLFHDDNPNLKVLIAGTYNAHPVNTNAAIATLKILKDESVYQQLDTLCSQLYDGLHSVLKEKAIPFSLVSNASAFCIYFSENAPKDAHDILLHHDFDLDMKFRRGLIQKGIYHIPIAAKQGSVSTAHSIQDIAKTLDITRQVLADI